MSRIEDYYDISNWRDVHVKMLRLANELGQDKWAARAVEHDKDASFPDENYEDFAEHGFLRLVIPEEFGGLGLDFWEYTTVAAEIGKYCGSTAITFNMHTSAMLWSRYMYEMPNLTEEEKAAFAPMRQNQFRKVVEDQDHLQQLLQPLRR